MEILGRIGNDITRITDDICQTNMIQDIVSFRVPTRMVFPCVCDWNMRLNSSVKPSPNQI
jgi:hypothetical protein